MSAARIQQIYIALFNRPADPLGLDFWLGQTNQGTNLTPMLAALAPTAEYQDRFSGLSTTQQVNSIYQALFGRDADLAGLTFFSNQINTGALTLTTLAVNILDGAQGTDATIITNKVTAATNFTAALDTGTEVLAYSGTAGITAGTTYLSGITSDAATVPDATATAAAITTLTQSNTGTPGASFVLTDKVDNFEGTSSANTFSGVVSDTAGNTTLGAGDSINGGAGTDTLNLILDGATPAYSPVATIAGIEVLNLKNVATGTAATVNLVGVTGLEQVWNDASLKNVTVTGLESNAAIGVRNTESDYDITFANSVLAAADTNVNVVLSGAAKGSSVTFGATSGTEGAETVTLNSTGKANTLDTILSDQSDFVTLKITGDQALTLGAVDSTLTTIDASAATAAVTATISAATTANNVKVTGSSKDDKFTTATTTADDSIDGGDGTDTVIATGTFGATLTNVENLTVENSGTSVSVDMEKAQSVKAITVENTGQVAGFIASNLAADTTITFDTDLAITNFGNAGTSAISLKTATGSSDQVTLKFTGNGAITAAGDTINVTGIEKLNIESGSAGITYNNADLFTDAADNTLGDIVLTGSGTHTVSATLTANSGVDLDGSALTGALTMTSAFNGGGATTLKSGAGNDTLLGATGVDTITAGDGNDQINGRAGSDDLTGGGGKDNFEFDDNAAGADTDIIQDFVVGTGASHDTLEFHIDSFGLSKLITGAGNAAVSDGDAVAIEEVSGQETLAGTDNFIVLTGATYSTTDAVETAIEAGGARQLTFANATTANDDILVAYSDGTDSYIATVNIASAATTITADNATVANAVKLVGVNVSVTGTLVDGNFLAYET